MAASEKKVKQPADQVKPFSAWWQVTAYALAGFAFFGSTIFAWQQLSRDDILPVTELRLVGEFDKVSAQQVKEIAVANMKGNFFTLDVDGMHKQVVELPWVHFAWVDRVWPNIVQVRVVEEKPVAYLQGTGLLNSDGEIFVATQELPEQSLPVVKGPSEERVALISAFRKFNQQFVPFGASLSGLELDDRGSWKLHLSSGLEILMGHDSVEYRLQRFLRIFGEKLSVEKAGIRRVDLRYSNGFALSQVEQDVQTGKTQNMVA